MRIRTIIGKEWAEVFKNRFVLFTVALMPLLLTAVAIGQLAATRYMKPSQTAEELPASMKLACTNQGVAEADCLQTLLAGQFLLLFLLMPLIVPVTIAAYSIVGEKITRSLEPLLATPISTAEIVLGKSLAAAVPAIAATWVSFGIFQAAAAQLVSGPVHAMIADVKWWAAMALLAPLLSVMSVNIAIMISSRVNDPRAAEQIGMLVMLPLVALFLAHLMGWATVTLGGVVVSALLLLALDAALVLMGVRLFQRETILTRWQ